MAFINADRIKETTTTTGTGAITLAGAVLGFRAFSSVMAIGDTCTYSVVSATLTESEAGIGTYSALNTLTRTTVQSSSNANAAVVFTAGVKDVFIGPIAGTLPPWNPVTNTITSGTWGGATISTAKGGTGLTSLGTMNQVVAVNATATALEFQTITSNPGTVTSVAATAGTGISITGSPITGSGTLGITNTAPDQTVSLTAGTGISATGTYPNFTITNTAPSSGGTVTSVAGAGTVSGLTLTGTVTSSGSLTLGGTLSAISLTTGVSGTLPVANGGTGVTTSTGTTNVVLSNSPTLVTPLANSLSAIPIVSGLTASVTAASSSGGILTYTATNTFTVGRTVSVTGLTTASGTTLNIAGMTIATASSTQFTVVNATVGVSSGTGTATAGGNTLAVSASNAVTAGPGGNYTIAAGSGVGVGKGGDIILQPGAQGSSGGDGSLIVKGQFISLGDFGAGTSIYFGGTKSGTYFYTGGGNAILTIADIYGNPCASIGGDVGGGWRMPRGGYVSGTYNGLIGVFGVGTSAPTATLHVVNSTASTKALIVQGAASQTASLQEWQNSAGTVLASVSAAGNIKTTALTVATLSAAATAGSGARAFVSDANATTFASVVAGGGANGVPVYSDGTNWRIG